MSNEPFEESNEELNEESNEELDDELFEESLDKLLEKWEEQTRKGESPNLKVLCEDCPEKASELQNRIDALKKVGSILSQEGIGKDEDHIQPLKMISHQKVELTLQLDDLEMFDWGGMGIVGRARDPQLGRDVAIKFMKPTNNTPISRGRFLNEAKVSGSMSHPGVLPVYGFGQTSDGLPFYAMRYVKGPSFEEAIDEYHRMFKHRNRRDQNDHLRKLLNHFISVTYTIAYAHERGVVHCDLKPQNILLGAFGETYVIDWGLAVGVSPRKRFEGLTEEHGAHGAGTKGYSHPDQLKGASPNRSWDIYALGAILHKLLSNRITGESERYDKIQFPKMKPNIPAPLVSICLQALRIEPRSHYERASEVADDVSRFLSGEPVSGHSEGILERLLRWQRSHQGATKLAGILLLLLLFVLAGSSFSLWRFAEENKRKTRASLETAVKFAAQTVALEMNNRWQALQLAARDPKILSELDRIQERGFSGSEVLQARIKHHRYAFQKNPDAGSSWFLCSSNGLQVARSPRSNRSTGRSYSHRDYFHGNGRDYEPNEIGEPLPGDPPYIEDSHHSIVYLSTSSATLRIAYSVPIYANPATDDERFIGIIGMSVELGGFRFIRGDVLRDHDLVLVDLREDWLDETAKRGLILEHPNLIKTPAQNGKTKGHPRLSDDLILRLMHLNQNDPSLYVEEFVDPVVDFSPHSPAAFSKVWVRGEGEIINDAQWAVIVQEDRD